MASLAGGAAIGDVVQRSPSDVLVDVVGDCLEVSDDVFDVHRSCILAMAKNRQHEDRRHK